jgi:hypothetical protein
MGLPLRPSMQTSEERYAFVAREAWGLLARRSGGV